MFNFCEKKSSPGYYSGAFSEMGFCSVVLKRNFEMSFDLQCLINQLFKITYCVPEIE